MSVCLIRNDTGNLSQHMGIGSCRMMENYLSIEDTDTYHLSLGVARLEFKNRMNKLKTRICGVAQPCTRKRQSPTDGSGSGLYTYTTWSCHSQPQLTNWQTALECYVYLFVCLFAFLFLESDYFQCKRQAVGCMLYSLLFIPFQNDPSSPSFAYQHILTSMPHGTAMSPIVETKHTRFS